MTSTIEERKNEAVKRMENLLMNRKCINEFKKGNVWMSESIGFLYEINDKKVQEKIKEFEKEYNATVYHLIHNMFEFGECYSFLYVSRDNEEWEDDNKILKQGYPYAYVWNVDDEWCSEIGSIGIKPMNGGIKRTY